MVDSWVPCGRSSMRVVVFWRPFPSTLVQDHSTTTNAASVHIDAPSKVVAVTRGTFKTITNAVGLERRKREDNEFIYERKYTISTFTVEK